MAKDTLHRIINSGRFINSSVEISVEINRPRHVEINRSWHVEINTGCQIMSRAAFGRPPTWCGGLRPPPPCGKSHYWQPVLISTCHDLLISTCRGLLISTLISTDELINRPELINLCRVYMTTVKKRLAHRKIGPA